MSRHLALGLVLEVVGCHGPEDEAVGGAYLFKQGRCDCGTVLLQAFVSGDVMCQSQIQPELPGRGVENLNCGGRDFRANPVPGEYNYFHGD